MDQLRLLPFIKETEIQARVKEIGAAITDRFRNKDLVAVGVLKGSFMFYADLVRAIDTDLISDFVGVSSYNDRSSTSGEVKVTMDLSRSIRDRNVILVEDIVDTGLTMNFLKRHFMSHKPKSITTVTLLLKPDALREECKLDHVGFKIPNDFVVGYGLDYQGQFRHLPYIAQVSNLN
jgi:hypoxanthine phosphoribosyltransferase